MNASAFSDLLGKLPDDMLADAFPNARRFQQAADETADHPKKANVLQKNTNPVTSSIFAPRWTIAAALAACLLFAAGFGALMLHGNHDELMTQSSQDDLEVIITTSATTQSNSSTSTVALTSEHNDASKTTISGTQNTSVSGAQDTSGSTEASTFNPTVPQQTSETTITTTTVLTEAPSDQTTANTDMNSELPTEPTTTANDISTKTEFTIPAFVPDPIELAYAREIIPQLIEKNGLSVNLWVADSDAYPQYPDTVVIEYNCKGTNRVLLTYTAQNGIDEHYLTFIYCDKANPWTELAYAREMIPQLIKQYGLSPHLWVADSDAYPQYPNTVVIEYNSPGTNRVLLTYAVENGIDEQFLTFIYCDQKKTDY